MKEFKFFERKEKEAETLIIAKKNYIACLGFLDTYLGRLSLNFGFYFENIYFELLKLMFLYYLFLS